MFPLQLLGFDVDFVNTVHFSNHTGYEKFAGSKLDPEEINVLYETMATNQLVGSVSHILQGYCPSPELLQNIYNMSMVWYLVLFWILVI